MVRVYLAGGFYSTYKNVVRGLLDPERFTLLDPEQAGGPSFPGWYVNRDLAMIESSGLLLAYQDYYPYVYGMAAEVGYAAARGVPVIYVCEAPRVDCFLAGLSKAIFTKIEPACNFISKRYGKQE